MKPSYIAVVSIGLASLGAGCATITGSEMQSIMVTAPKAPDEKLH